jgi:hypothetical protein
MQLPNWILLCKALQAGILKEGTKCRDLMIERGGGYLRELFLYRGQPTPDVVVGNALNSGRLIIILAEIYNELIQVTLIGLNRMGRIALLKPQEADKGRGSITE